MSADLEPAWKAWVKAHHAHGCAERNRVDAEHCRYRAAHIATAREIAADLGAQGWTLVQRPGDGETVAIW